MILRNLPRVLEPLSQTPGPMMVMSRFGAVGPVVAEALRRRGVEVTVTPDHGYFMKPLVSAFLTAFSR